MSESTLRKRDPVKEAGPTSTQTTKDTKQKISLNIHFLSLYPNSVNKLTAAYIVCLQEFCMCYSQFPLCGYYYH